MFIWLKRRSFRLLCYPSYLRIFEASFTTAPQTQADNPTEPAAVAVTDGDQVRTLTPLKLPQLPSRSPSHDARTSLEKYADNTQLVTRHTKKQLLTAMENGHEAVVPFRFWKIAIKRTLIKYDAYDDLLPKERTIYVEHMTAVQRRRLYYKDPFTKENVHTVSALLLLEKCCGKMCRHCPYEMENVPPELKHKKIFNGAYYL